MGRAKTTTGNNKKAVPKKRDNEKPTKRCVCPWNRCEELQNYFLDERRNNDPRRGLKELKRSATTEYLKMLGEVLYPSHREDAKQGHKEFRKSVTDTIGTTVRLARHHFTIKILTGPMKEHKDRAVIKVTRNEAMNCHGGLRKIEELCGSGILEASGDGPENDFPVFMLPDVPFRELRDLYLQEDQSENGSNQLESSDGREEQEQPGVPFLPGEEAGEEPLQMEQQESPGVPFFPGEEAGEEPLQMEQQESVAGEGGEEPCVGGMEVAAVEATPTQVRSLEICKPFIILPNAGGEKGQEVKVGLELIQMIDHELKRSKKFLEALYEEEKSKRLNNTHGESIREIDGNRYELFVDCSRRKSTAFEKILYKVIGGKGNKLEKETNWDPTPLQVASIAGIKLLVVQYCKNQSTRADKGPRNNWRYDNFAILVSYGKVKAQAPHIDIVGNTLQFGCMVSHNCPATQFFETATEITDVEGVINQWKDVPEELKQHWRESTSEGIEKMREQLEGFVSLLIRPKEMLEKRAEVANTVHSGGQGDAQVATSDQVVGSGEDQPCRKAAKAARKKQLIPSGAVVVSGARTIHAGPKCEHYRSLIFFTATPPESSKSETYDPDLQLSGTTLIGNMIIASWDGLSFPSRLYLLKKFEEYVLAYQSIKTNTHTHFEEKDWPQLHNFIKTLESKEWKSFSEQKKMVYFTQFAQRESIEAEGEGSS
jgi:hypothetical protein